MADTEENVHIWNLRRIAGDVLEEAMKALEAMNTKNWRKQRDVAAGFIRQVQQP